MLHILRKIYFGDPIHVFGVLYLTKPIFRFHVKNIDISLLLAQEVTLSIVLCFDDNKPNKCYLVLMF